MTTLIHLATRLGLIEIAKFIIEENPESVFLRDTLREQTALHIAAYEGNREAVKLLIEKGSDLNVKRDDKSTPLHLAVFKDRLKIVELLVENNAKMDLKNCYNQTPLNIAYRDEYLDIVRVMLKHGAVNNYSNIYQQIWYNMIVYLF